MWLAPALAAGTAGWMAAFHAAALAVAGPVLLLWLASPAIAWWISLPLVRRPTRLTAEQTRFLGRVARRTWAFFEAFVGEEDHWLPPDNYQESRDPQLAHRTSPTNMGLALLANLSAYDFGYIPAGQLVERTAHALETMAELARYHGHFYNWYDTQSLQPLHPAYVSTVDSGNLAGHLLTLRPGLIALLDRPILEPRWLDGLRDTLGILEEDAQPPHRLLWCASVRTSKPHVALPRPPSARRDSLSTSWCAAPRRSAESWAHEPGSEAGWWAQALVRQCQGARDEVELLAPWTALPEPPDGLDHLPEVHGIPTLRALAGLDVALSRRVADPPETGATPGAWTRGWPICAATSGWAASAPGPASRPSSAWRCRPARWRTWSTTSSTTRPSRLLSIGYNVDARRRDASFYDLLASEARLCVFVAIAQGRLPQESWFALGRLLTTAGGGPVLLSWSGSMFEYLMPQLVMPTYEHTLLDQTVHAAVARQIEYGRQRNVPWGMSESGYNALDVHLNYQYRAFGVPGLGLKRGLAEDLVVAPYASVLALMVAPEAACLNLQRLAAAGAEGRFGFHEAVDYTPARQRRGESHALVRSWMAHHQGMSLLALASLLLDRRMQRRFESDPLFRATVPLLQERIPRASAFYAYIPEPTGVQAGTDTPRTPIRVLDSPDTPNPEVQLLSNGRYHVMVTNAGGGYTRWNDLAVTRWREDGTRDPWGTFCYLRDVDGGTMWTTAHQPTSRAAGAATRRSSRRGARNSAAVTATSRPIRRSPCRRRTTSSSAGCTSPTAPVSAGPSRSRATRRWCWPRPPPTRCILRSAISSCRPRSSPRRRAILCTRRPRSSDDAGAVDVPRHGRARRGRR